MDRGRRAGRDDCLRRNQSGPSWQGQPQQNVLNNALLEQSNARILRQLCASSRAQKTSDVPSSLASMDANVTANVTAPARLLLRVADTALWARDRCDKYDDGLHHSHLVWGHVRATLASVCPGARES